MHIPRLICGNCAVEMQCERVGEVIHMLDSNGQPYYKMSADRWTCIPCDNTVLVPAAHARAEHWQEGYADIKVDVIGRFR